MPLTRISAEAFGVLTICLVALLILLGLVCIGYTFYLRSRVLRQGFIQLSYFSGPWVIRITFVLFTIWWGFGEIIRLNFLRRQGRVLNALDLKWQENVCKFYIVSNLGFAEPCLFLILVFLLRAPLQNIDTGILSRKWNGKTAGCVLLFCLPLFVLQLFLVLIGSELRKVRIELPPYFTRIATPGMQNSDHIALCTYPLLNTLLLGLFASVLTAYLLWLGRRILKLVINKGLRKRVYTLIFSVSTFLPLRVILLGLSVFSKPEQFLFEALSFSAFLVLLCCAGVCIVILVYCPVADCLALGNLNDLEARRNDHNDAATLIANQGHLEGSVAMSPERGSDASTKRGSISFRTYVRDETPTEGFVELSLFSPSRDGSLPGSPSRVGWPMRSSPSTQVHGP
ncbi:hypothetical protein GQ457_17G001360 [Hibiscus cannabinus]